MTEEIRGDTFLPSIFNGAYGQQFQRQPRSASARAFGRRRLSQFEIDDFYEYEWMIQNLVDTLPDECTRAWVSYRIGENPELIGQFIGYQSRIVKGSVGISSKEREETLILSIQDIFNEALKDERLTGGALIYISLDDGRQPWEPVDYENIKTINYLQELDRYAVTPLNINDADIGGKSLPQANNNLWDMSTPTHYNLNTGNNASVQSGTIHRSRFLRFGGAVRLSFRSRQRNQGWGNSVIQTFIKPFLGYESKKDQYDDLLSELVKKTWKIKGLWDKIIRGKEEEIRKRIAEFASIESSYRYRVIDKDDEDITETSLNLTEAYRSVDAALDECVAASNLPRTYLLGVSPAGKLGVSGGSEQTDMAKMVLQYQMKHIDLPLRQFNTLCWLAKDSPTKGEIPNGFGWDFNSTHPLSEKEKAEIFSTYSSAFGGYLQSQVLMPDEVAQSVFGGSEPQYNIALNQDKRKRMEEADNAPPEEISDEDAQNINI